MFLKRGQAHHERGPDEDAVMEDGSIMGPGRKKSDPELFTFMLDANNAPKDDYTKKKSAVASE